MSVISDQTQIRLLDSPWRPELTSWLSYIELENKYTFDNFQQKKTKTNEQSNKETYNSRPVVIILPQFPCVPFTLILYQTNRLKLKEEEEKDIHLYFIGSFQRIIRTLLLRISLFWVIDPPRKFFPTLPGYFYTDPPGYPISSTGGYGIFLENPIL